MSVKVLSKTERFGILKQTNWATPAAANALFKLCQWINTGSINPNPDVQVDQFNVTSQNGIHYESERFFVDSTSGMATVPFSGTCEKATMAPFLVAAFQVVAEAVGTPFEKTITCGGLTSPIDFAGDAGYVFTIAIDQGGSADDGIIVENCIIDNLNLVWDLNSRGITKLVNMTGAFKGNEINYEQTLNGVWTNTTIAQSFFNNTDAWGVNFGGLLLTIGGVDYSAQCIRRFELQINNNVTSNCKTTGGKSNQYDIAPEYKVLLHLDYNEVTEKIIKDYQEGVAATMNWSNDSADTGATGMWSIVFPVLRIMSPPGTYNGIYKAVNLEMRAYSETAATPLTMYYSDSVDYGY